MNEAVAIMTGATEPGAVGYEQVAKEAERADTGHARRGSQVPDGGVTADRPPTGGHHAR